MDPRTDPLALGGQPFELRGFGVRVAHFSGIETELVGQSLRHAFEALDAGSCEFGAA